MLYYIIAILIIWIIYKYCDLGLIENYENKNKTIIYWFHRPNCSYCEKMRGEWELLTKSVISNDKYQFVAVNTADDRNNTLAADFGVESVPHIVKVAPNGSRTVYNGNRTEPDMKKWALL